MMTESDTEEQIIDCWFGERMNTNQISKKLNLPEQEVEKIVNRIKGHMYKDGAFEDD